MATKKDYVVGSANVFADLGYPRPEEAAAKAELAHKITKIIERRKLTQAEAANVLEVDQPKISALRRGKLTGFSLDRLVRFLVLLGSDDAGPASIDLGQQVSDAMKTISSKQSGARSSKASTPSAAPIKQRGAASTVGPSSASRPEILP